MNRVKRRRRNRRRVKEKGEEYRIKDGNAERRLPKGEMQPRREALLGVHSLILVVILG